jgi:3-oxoacyl-[acyl-carrier protein] reductase
VIVNYPTDEEAADGAAVREQIESIGGRAIACRADVSAEFEVDVLVAAGLAAFGQIDILVNNAGIALAAPVQEILPADWDRVLGVHLRSTFLMTRRVLPLMYAQRFGRIINTASQLAYKGAPGFSHYTAAKGAIISFTRSVALEVGASGITVNCVAPGATRTPMLGDVPDDLLEQIRRAIPLGRLAEVDDVVPSYVFLAGEEGRHYHGQCISPNGGDQFL